MSAHIHVEHDQIFNQPLSFCPPPHLIKSQRGHKSTGPLQYDPILNFCFIQFLLGGSFNFLSFSISVITSNNQMKYQKISRFRPGCSDALLKYSLNTPYLLFLQAPRFHIFNFLFLIKVEPRMHLQQHNFQKSVVFLDSKINSFVS
jgi:hypothetical protein